MADLDPSRPSDASNITYLIEQLERLDKAGDLNAAEKQVLSELRAKQSAAQQTIGSTKATYRGVASGALLGAKDELSGAIDAMRGGSYAQGRDDTRALDRAAEQAFPQEFRRGKLAGTGITALAPGIGTLKATQGLGLLAKSGYGGLVGALTAGGQGFAEGEGGFLPRLQNAAIPAGIGGAFGMAAPLAGAAVGGLARLARNNRRSIPGLSARATNAVVRPLSRAQASGTDIQAYLNSLGDEGMLADVPGNLRRTAQGLAAMPGEGGELLGDAITQRAQGASARIRSDVDATLGSADAAFEARRAEAASRSGTFGPMYEAALGAEGALQVRPLLNSLKQAQSTAGPKTAPVLNDFIRDLEEKAQNGLIDPTQLHWIRSDMDGVLRSLDGPTKNNALLRKAVKEMDSILDTIPGYKAARQGYGNSYAIEEAIEAGRQVFRGGEATAMSPKVLREELARLTPAQQDAFKKGAREWVDALMGTSRNDAAAAWGAFEKGWNDEKLTILLGDEAAARVMKRLRAESTFSKTRGDVLAGSQTQMRAEAANSLADLRMPDGGQRPGPLRRGLNAVGEVGNNLVDRILYAGRQDVNKQVGSLLSMQGPARDAMVQGLLREAMLRQRPTATERFISPSLDALLRSTGAVVAVE